MYLYSLLYIQYYLLRACGQVLIFNIPNHVDYSNILSPPWKPDTRGHVRTQNKNTKSETLLSLQRNHIIFSNSSIKNGLALSHRKWHLMSRSKVTLCSISLPTSCVFRFREESKYWHRCCKAVRRCSPVAVHMWTCLHRKVFQIRRPVLVRPWMSCGHLQAA